MKINFLWLIDSIENITKNWCFEKVMKKALSENYFSLDWRVALNLCTVVTNRFSNHYFYKKSYRGFWTIITFSSGCHPKKSKHNFLNIASVTSVLCMDHCKCIIKLSMNSVNSQIITYKYFPIYMSYMCIYNRHVIL